MLEQAIRSKDFFYALGLIGNGERLPATIDKREKAYLLEILIKNKQFDILHLFAHYKTIETDIYEYESFEYSFFDIIGKLSPVEDDIVEFFDIFIGHFTNINDEVKGETLLSYALTNKANIHVIKTLIGFGCDVNFRNNEDENLIHQIVKSSNSRHNIYFEEQCDLMFEAINLLVNEGVEIDGKSTENKTPLISALQFQRNHFLKVLLQNGANPNHIDNSGNNAFYYAITYNRDLDAYKKLCEFETPELNNLNTLKETVLFTYAKEIRDNSEQIQDTIKQLIEDGADLYQTCFLYGTEKKTPLDCIAEKSVEVLKAALETGKIDINYQNDDGDTLLHKVCAYTIHQDHDKAKEIYKKVKLLIEEGADTSITNDKDQTALMLASDDNYKIKTVELLLKTAK